MVCENGQPMRPTFHIAVFEGDGIGPEIMAPALRVLKTAAEASRACTFTFETVPAGAAHYAESGVALPPSSLKAAREADAILLSAMGLPHVRYPDGTEISPQIELRMALDLYAGMRPVFVLPGANCPLSDPRALDIDFVLVRESTEGLFASVGRGVVDGDSEARETLRITRKTSEKLFDFAFRLARQRKQSGRGRGEVICVDKANVFKAFAFFRDIFVERSAEFSDIGASAEYVDAIAMRFVQRPWEFDVLVTENMFGDILSDLGAGIMGSLGLAPSGDIGDEHAVFQPCHGSAPDIAGRGVANPMAMILSAAMMADWLGHQHAEPGLIACGERIRRAVGEVLVEGNTLTADLGGSATTDMVGLAVEQACGELVA